MIIVCVHWGERLAAQYIQIQRAVSNSPLDI